MFEVNKISSQKIVILSLTIIAIATELVMCLCILFAHIESLEVISLFISVITGIIGVFGGIYVGKDKLDGGSSLNDGKGE